MQDLNSIPGLQEMFEKSYPELAKMNAVKSPPTPNLGSEPLKVGKGPNIFLTLLGVGLGIGLIYFLVTKNQRENEKFGDDRSKKSQNLN